MGRQGFSITHLGPGEAPSVALGADGLALIAYVNGRGLKVAHCSNVACTEATKAKLDTTGDVGDGGISLTIGADDLGLISYVGPSESLKVAHCQNVTCSDATTATLDTAGGPSSIVLGTDGLGLIAYYDAAHNAVRIAHCSDLGCATSTTTTSCAPCGYPGPPALTIGGDGRGLAAYPDDDFGIAIAHCVDVACSATTMAHVSTGVIEGQIVMTTASDGFGLFSLADIEGGLAIGHCTNHDCSSFTWGGASVDWVRRIAITVGADGLGLVAVLRGGDPEPFGLSVLHCQNTACTSGNVATVDRSFDGSGGAVSITVGADGLPLIVYAHDRVDLDVAHCSNLLCTPPRSTPPPPPPPHHALSSGDRPG